MNRIFLMVVLMISGLGLYLIFLPSYACVSVVFDRSFPQNESPIEVCAPGEVSPSNVKLIDGFFDSLKNADENKLEEIFSNSIHSKSAGLVNYKKMILRNFSEGKEIEVLVAMTIGGKRVFSVLKKNTGEKLTLIIEEVGPGNYLYSDYLDDQFWDSMLAALSLRETAYREYRNYHYPLELLGYAGDRRLQGVMDSCCFVRLSDSSIVIEGEGLKKTEEYKKYVMFVGGVKNRGLPKDLFHDDKDRVRIMSSLQSDFESTRSHWDLGSPNRLYKGGEASILVSNNSDNVRFVLFLGGNGDKKLYGLTKRTNIDRLVWMNYARL